MSLSPSAALPRLRTIATGAVFFCVVAMIAFRLLEPTHIWAGYARAFFEAATVGALADWFAVVALFRHPLGIPLPHTAVLPRNKHRVAESLATFVESSFLTPEVLKPYFDRINYADILARWLAEHAPFLAQQACSHAPRILDALDDQSLTELLASRARALIADSDLSPLAGRGLEILVDAGRDRKIFDSVLDSARLLIAEHRPLIQAKIRDEIPLSADLLGGFPPLRNLAGPLLQQLGDALAATVAEKTIEKVQAILAEASVRPDHPLWQSFDSKLRSLITDLKSSDELAARVRTLQSSLSESSLLDDFASHTWTELRAFILADTSVPDSLLRSRIEEAIHATAHSLANNPQLNAFFSTQILTAALATKPHVRELVTDTIANWDASDMASRLEATVGRDLQFIRLNGTIVGGLVGLTIHALFQAFGI